MLDIVIPDSETFRLEYLVLDFNGTLAVDGVLLPGVAEALRQLARDLRIHVVTADTFGLAREALVDIPCELTILPRGQQDVAKRRHVERLGQDRCVCIGNGRNDRLMLAAAAVGIAVIQAEGAAMETVTAANVLVTDIGSALGLLLNPDRLIATLRH